MHELIHHCDDSDHEGYQMSVVKVCRHQYTVLGRIDAAQDRGAWLLKCSITTRIHFAESILYRKPHISELPVFAVTSCNCSSLAPTCPSGNAHQVEQMNTNVSVWKHSRCNFMYRLLINKSMISFRTIWCPRSWNVETGEVQAWNPFLTTEHNRKSGSWHESWLW